MIEFDLKHLAHVARLVASRGEGLATALIGRTDDMRSADFRMRWKHDDLLNIMNMLSEIIDIGGAIHLQSAVAQSKRLLEELKNPSFPLDFDDDNDFVLMREQGVNILASCLQHIATTIVDELEAKQFVMIEHEYIEYLKQTEPLFGKLVENKFADASEDISEAGKCLSFDRGTGSVFHLMRVMELGVHALAKKLIVKGVDPRVDSWDHIANHINMAINKLPAKTAKNKAKKEALGGASAHLNAVRIAWRNPTMHPKKTYTVQQANDVFSATRAFMNHLAGLM